MKKLVTISALMMTMSMSTAFAHHPAEDIVDPEIYAMIDENVSDTPHADLVFDDMGSAVSANEDPGATDTSDMADVSGAESAMEMNEAMNADADRALSGPGRNR